MKLLIPRRIRDAIEPTIRAVAAVAVIVPLDDDGAPGADPHGAEVLLRWWTPVSVMRRSLLEVPGIRWVHTPTAGVDHLLIPELIERGVILTNSAGATAIPIAEFTLMFMLNHAKRAIALTRPDPALWQRADDASLLELAGRTVTILVFGQIGREIARRCAAFGMRVLAVRRRPRPEPDVARVVGVVDWHALLPETDYLVVALPLTDATRGMVDAAALARLRRGAYLINIARGAIVDTDAMLAALHDGRLGGAGLDALPEEPLPDAHPLWRAPNVTITPHIAYSSPDTRERIFAIFGENLRRFRAGEPLCNVVDLAAGY
jgi:phosphoglycerate dehydrogenase-like enzyme